ncbi:MAG: GGDEF domain-containing protein [Anaerolineales bacterium]
MKIFADLEKKSHLFWIITGLISVAGVGVFDTWTGSEISFSLFYLIPILFVTWFAGRKPGLVISLAGAVAWFAADALAGHTYSQPGIRYWNAAVRLGFFVIVTFLLPALKELEREKEMARTDYLTGAANRRFFFELVQRELNRSQRYHFPFAIVYIDLDNLKTINDQLGHRDGDEVLCAVTRQARKHLRKMDTIARVGGDEFMLLLPEVDQVALQIVVSRIQLALLGEMQRNNWPVTFSIGALTCYQAQIGTDELIKKADKLMYSVKNNGKNAIAYSAYTG